MTRLESRNGYEQSTGVSYSEWLATVVGPKNRRFNIEQAFSKKLDLLALVEDPEDRAYLEAVGETRTAYREGDPTLRAKFPKDHSRMENLKKQLKVVHDATPIPEWQSAKVKRGSLVVHGEIKAEVAGRAYNPIG